MLPINYAYHLWFRVCKPLRGKYKLSTNCLLILHGACVYDSIHHKPFTRTQLLQFVKYFDNVRIGKYMTVLIGLGYFKESDIYKSHQRYCVSPLGNQVIQELNESYNNVLYSFCDQYGIIL